MIYSYISSLTVNDHIIERIWTVWSLVPGSYLLKYLIHGRRKNAISNLSSQALLLKNGVFYTAYAFKGSTILFCLNFDNAMPIICRTLSLDSFTSLPISSQDCGVCPFSPKCNLKTCASLSVSTVWNSFSSSCFNNSFLTMFSGIDSSGPGMISYHISQLNLRSVSCIQQIHIVSGSCDCRSQNGVSF